MKGTIRFFTEDVDFKIPQPILTRQWLRQAASLEGFDINELLYISCSDSYLHQINLDYLSHDTFTDIITFDLSEDKAFLEGEIYLSIPRVLENSTLFGVPFEQELRRVLVHGLLHLCGYKDKKPVEISKMKEREEFHLLRFPKKL